MNKDFIYEDQKQLIEMWKNKYYEQKKKLQQLKNNWNELKKDIGYELLKLREPNEYNKGLCNAFTYINSKMQELEQGSDSNE